MQADKLLAALGAAHNQVAEAHNELVFHFYRPFMSPPPMTSSASADAVVAKHNAVTSQTIEMVTISPTYQSLREQILDAIDDAIGVCHGIAAKRTDTGPLFATQGWDNNDTAATSTIDSAFSTLQSSVMNYAQTIEQEFIDNGGSGSGGQPINP